jgi:hypothetical protein
MRASSLELGPRTRSRLLVPRRARAVWVAPERSFAVKHMPAGESLGAAIQSRDDQASLLRTMWARRAARSAQPSMTVLLTSRGDRPSAYARPESSSEAADHILESQPPTGGCGPSIRGRSDEGEQTNYTFERLMTS